MIGNWFYASFWKNRLNLFKIALNLISSTESFYFLDGSSVKFGFFVRILESSVSEFRWGIDEFKFNDFLRSSWNLVEHRFS